MELLRLRRPSARDRRLEVDHGQVGGPNVLRRDISEVSGCSSSRATYVVKWTSPANASVTVDAPPEVDVGDVGVPIAIPPWPVGSDRPDGAEDDARRGIEEAAPVSFSGN